MKSPAMLKRKSHHDPINCEILTRSISWDRIADPDAEPPGVEPGLQALIDEVKIVVQEECFIIKRAFPFYEEVLTNFLQRVFQQSVELPSTKRMVDSANMTRYNNVLRQCCRKPIPYLP
jgi:hypothetical protein